MIISNFGTQRNSNLSLKFTFKNLTWSIKKVKHSTESATLRRFLGEEKLAVSTHLNEKMLKFQIFEIDPQMS